MRKFTILLFLTLVASSTALGQSLTNLLKQIGQIKPLESTRADAKRILREYETNDGAHHYQEFSNDKVTIEITYATGACSGDPDDEDASEVWNVREWTVTGIEISPDEPTQPKDVGLDPSRFKKERRYPNDPDSSVFFDKVAGFAFKTTEDGIEKFIFFPSSANRSRLCRTSTATKGFYVRNGWFSEAKPYDYACVLINQPANVEEVKLSAIEIDAASTSALSVVTVARDPENDVLTYTYKVSAGRIIGQGWNVTWDLTDVAPGTYSITVGVDDGAGVVGRVVTKMVTLK